MAQQVPAELLARPGIVLGTSRQQEQGEVRGIGQDRQRVGDIDPALDLPLLKGEEQDQAPDLFGMSLPATTEREQAGQLVAEDGEAFGLARRDGDEPLQAGEVVDDVMQGRVERDGAEQLIAADSGVHGVSFDSLGVTASFRRIPPLS